MRIFVPRKRLGSPAKLTQKEIPAELGPVIARTHLPVYDGRDALIQSGLARLDEGRRRRDVR